MIIHASSPLFGTLKVPGDKSISHRAIMFGAISSGETRISGFLKSADCLATIDCFRKMGINIFETEENGKPVMVVRGKGLHGLAAPASDLDAKNSGTTTRLMSGILAGQSFTSRIVGDASLSRRPMDRVIRPLTHMGARVSSNGGRLPLSISGGKLTGISYKSPVASAQVKSCIVLAGLYADSPTTVIEPALSRNHTENLLKAFGADISSKPEGKSGSWACTVTPAGVLTGRDIRVPGDISSAAYLIAAALLVPGSYVRLTDVGINPTRDGILRVAKMMGGQVATEYEHEENGELIGDVIIKSSSLHGATIGGSLIPTLIDELPIIAVMAACATGETVIKDAAELRVKESDRITLVVDALRRMGVLVHEEPDGMVIEGNGARFARGLAPLDGIELNPCGDHRMAMAFAVAGLVASGETCILDDSVVAVSYPNFYKDITSLMQG